MSIGERIRKHRIAHGYSRAELAVLVGRSGEQIRRYELDEQDVTLKVAKKIATLFGVTVDELTEPLGDDAPARSELKPDAVLDGSEVVERRSGDRRKSPSRRAEAEG